MANPFSRCPKLIQIDSWTICKVKDELLNSKRTRMYVHTYVCRYTFIFTYIYMYN